jgi:tungstate transport system substrate-binding protein
MMWRVLTFLVLLAAPLSSAQTAASDESDLLLATTTSVRDSGLLDALLPRFREASGIRVRPIAVGTGAALRMGADGNADILLTHAPTAEEELLASGAVSSRTPFMENHFVIAGPADDPARISLAASAVEAFGLIHATKAPYVSRGDDSGTHKREVELLRAARLDPRGGWPGFASTGLGMGLSLQVAGERQAYILSDLGTFLAYRERTGLRALSKSEPALRNEYSLLRVNPERFPRVHAVAARRFEAFLISPETQLLIRDFGRERYGQPLFRPLRSAATGSDE